MAKRGFSMCQFYCHPETLGGWKKLEPSEPSLKVRGSAAVVNPRQLSPASGHIILEWIHDLIRSHIYLPSLSSGRHDMYLRENGSEEIYKAS